MATIARHVDALVPESALSRIAEDVARNMASALVDERGAYIRTPLLYPGGSCVVVAISGADDRFFVSDMGLGMSEAELVGAESQYARIGGEIARRSGVGFDHHSFFLATCRRDQLVEAVATVANCSKEAVGLATLRLAEKRHPVAETALYDRLDRLFGKTLVERDASISGANKKDWKVGALVHHNDNILTFDFVKPSPHSAYPIVAKFLDFAQLDHPPHPVAVVGDFKEMASYVGLISDAGGRVIEASASDLAFLAA